MSQKKLTITGEGALLKGLLTNAIHMGAHAAFHEPDTAVNPHQGQGGDTQTRTLAGGARKKEVDSMVAAGHAKEEDRAMLESLPDDHFKSVQTFATRGAAQPIVPYSYQGIGDRSNAPAGNTAKTMTTEEWLAQTNAPPEIRQAVQNQRAQELKVRGRCMTILMNSNPNLNLKWLETQTTENLRNLAAMAAPPKNNNQPNYGGQGDIPMFLNNNGSVTNTDPNAVQEDDDTLALPVLDFTKAS